MSFSEPLVRSGMSGCFNTLCARSRSKSLSSLVKPVSVEKMASKRRSSCGAARRWRLAIRLEILGEAPDAGAGALPRLDVPLAERIELVNEAFRMHPAERALRDP